MTDNIFDRLAELLQSAGPVNWRLGVQIAESVAGAADPVDPWVAEEYEELGRTAINMSLCGRSRADLHALQASGGRRLRPARRYCCQQQW